MWLSFTSDTGKRRLEWAPEGFELERATDAELAAILARDGWGLLRKSHPTMDGGSDGG